jgi:hypothetical protein
LFADGESWDEEEEGEIGEERVGRAVIYYLFPTVSPTETPSVITSVILTET